MIILQVTPGETALAFYSAENPTDNAIIGISTYTVTPYTAAPYFNKIQVKYYLHLSSFKQKR
jgi:cytochrome c oxidase assembly protein subunit 11